MNELQEHELQRAKSHAKAKGGECLSNVYKNNKAKLLWKCTDEKHPPWEARFYSVIKNETWCPKCWDKERPIAMLARAKTHAKSKDGKCLSNEYKNNATKLIWKCHVETHKPWSSSYSLVVTSGHWCPECWFDRLPNVSKKKNGLQDAKHYAATKNGFCLSTKYEGFKERLLWKCQVEEHQPWKATFDKVVNFGSWCPECGRESSKNKQKNQEALQISKDHAKRRGGECLSTEYKNAHQHMIWKCENPNHPTWKAPYGSVVTKGHWCPQCANERHICEDRVRLIFESHFKSQFPSVRPDWNINPWTGNLLELDGYCSEFNIAFEHDGEHHHEIVRGNSLRDLAYQKFKDEQKKKNCKRNDILLINIPIIEESQRNNFEAFLAHVLSHCRKHDLDMSFSQKQLEELQLKFSR
ncbi:hypothetical protein [Ralstonia insidiosa]|uniref:hypothetical protein n=1 Tax=Ralstonia insidiosa TaxID=190721 RepID=UPI000ACDFB96|nr:hypothetical protein [Ralstonia insidiosa]